MTASDGTAGDRASRGWKCFVTALLAVLVAVIVTSPVWRFRHEMGDGFRGIAFLGASDGEQYVTQFRKMLDGGFGRENDILYEWSRGPQTYDYPAYRIFLAPLRLLNVDLHAYVAWMTGLCAAAQFVLLTALARRLGLARAGAHVVALACCLVPFLWSFHGHERWLFAPERLSIDFLPLYRPMNPSFTSLFLWGGLLVLLRWIERPNVLGWIAITALAAFGFDIYAPVFTMFGGLVAGAAVVLAVRRRFRDAAILAVAGAVGVAANLRVLGGSVAGSNAATTAALEGNVNAVVFRDPILTGDVLSLLVVAGVAILLNVRRPLSAGALLVAVAAPVSIALQFNQHLVTGRIYQPFHYDWMYSVPFLWLAVGALAPRLTTAAERVGEWLRQGRRWQTTTRVFGGLLIVVVVLALGGRLTAPVLRAVGAIRAETIARPWTLASAGAVAVGSTWILARFLRQRRLGAATFCVCFALGLLALVEGWQIQETGYRHRKAEHVEFQAVAPAIYWIRANAGTDAVVACGHGSLPRLFTSYAGCDVFVSLEVIFYGSPPEDEYLERRLLWLALYGVTREELAAQLGDDGHWHYEVFKWRTFGPPPPKLALLSYGVNPSPLGPDAIPNVLAKYDAVLAMTPAQRLARYRLDYVLWSDRDPPAGFRDPGATYPLRVVVDEPGCRLYRVSR